MSAFDGEVVPRMPAMSIAKLERLGIAIAETLGLDFSAGPQPVEWLPLIDGVLQEMGILVYPVWPHEIDGDLGATDPRGGPETAILLTIETYDALGDRSRHGNQARATMAHEFAHAVLHVPIIRRYSAEPHGDMLLRRVQRSSIKAYHDPEWQAWVLAGCIVAPRSAILRMRGARLQEMADAFGLSMKFLSNHLRRLHLTHVVAAIDLHLLA